MSFTKNIIAGLILILFTLNVGAAETNATTSSAPKAKLRGPAEFQKVIDDYKAYVAKIPPKIRDEIIEYRKSVAKLNKQKRLLFRQLSQASQNYLKKERKYKKKLPLSRKNLINIENPGAKASKKSAKK